MASESASLDHTASEIVAMSDTSKRKRSHSQSIADSEENSSQQKNIRTNKGKGEHHSEHERSGGSRSTLQRVENLAQNARKTRTLRISSLSTSATAESIRGWLGKENVLSEINGAPLDVLQLSLAPRGKHTAQATVTLKDLPLDINKVFGELEGPDDSTIIVDDHFLGLTVLYDGAARTNVKADIVAIHGLGGHALGSWKASRGHKVWLRDFLPVQIPNARVMTYGYDTNLKKQDWKKTIESLAKTLLENLCSIRDSEATRPLIFITHSLGGLLVKQALVICAQQQQYYQPYMNILESCLSLVFFAVPHHGMRFDRLRDITAGKGSAVLISDLLLDPDGEESPYLAHLNDAFIHAVRDRNTDILHYYESKKTDASLKELPVGSGQINQVDNVMVTKISASYTGLEKPCHILSLDGDHRSLIKFQTELECETVVFRIRQFLQRVQSEPMDTNQRPERVFTEDEKNLLKSLSFPEMDRRLKGITMAENSTCRWLNTHSSYQTWSEARSSLLWIKGHPGSGKSTLLKYAIAQENQANVFVASFFFNGRGSLLEKVPAGLYRSLLHKLLQFAPEKHREIAQVYKNRCDTHGKFEEGWSWHEKELEIWLKDLLLCLSIHHLRIYVDAIDEGGKEVALNLVTYFQRIVSKAIETGGLLKVCLSCRHYPLLPGTIKLELNVEDENQIDIAEYSRTEFASGGVGDEKAQILEKAIIEKANGIFQWAVIVIPRMINLYRIGTNLQRIQEAIKQLPEELDELYQEIMKKIPNDERDYSLLLIQWICCAIRPLSLDEIRYATIVSKDMPYRSLSDCQEDGGFIESNADMENRIKHFSRGLAEVKKHEDSNWIQIIHQSVQDYFVISGLQLMIDQPSAISIGQTHFQLAWSCVRYIEMEEIKLASEEACTPEMTRYRRVNQAKFNEKLAQSHPFAKYAALSWASHCEHAEPNVHPKELLELFDLFHSPLSTLLENWIFLVTSIDLSDRLLLHPNPRGFTALHIMTYYGLFKTTSGYFAQYDVEADCGDSYGRTPLSHAAENGHEKIVRLLVDRTDVTPDMEDKFEGWTPLSYAAVSGHVKIVQLLVSRSDVKADSKNREGQTVLSRAARYGEKSVVQLLMERKDVTVDSMDQNGWTPLLHAARNGHAEIVKLLLARKDVNANIVTTGYKETPLSSAAKHGHKEVVQLLLNCKNVNADHINEDGQTPISLAATSGHKEIIQLLIQHGHVKVDRNDLGKQTPLSHAAKNGHKDVVELLASRHDVDLNSRDQFGRTPLSWAADQGKEEIVQLLVLLDGVNKDAKDARGRTPLSYAAAEDHIGVVQVLLQTESVDINSADIDGRTPLTYAAKAYYEHTAHYLLERKGIEVDHPDNSGKTPLSWASYAGNDKVVWTLLARKDVQINSKDTFGRTPLMNAVTWGKMAVIQQLLEHDDVEVNSRDRYGETALSLVVSGNNKAAAAVVRQLLDCSRVQADPRDDEGRTPLSYAAGNGLIEAVRLLVQSKDVMIDSKDKYGRTPFSYAADGRHETVMNLLKAGRQ